MTPLDQTLLPTEAWRPAEQSQGRAATRISERELERIPAWIASPRPGAREVPVKLRDCSAGGFAVLVASAHTDRQAWKIGEAVRLHLRVDAQDVFADCAIRNSSFQKNEMRLGLGRADLRPRPETDPGAAGIEVPEGGLVRLPRTAHVKAEVRNPLLFGEWSLLRLTAIRTGMICDFSAPDGGCPFFVGQETKIHFSISTAEGNGYLGRIARLEPGEGNGLRLRVEPVEMSASLANDLAEMLATEAGIHPDSLRDLGFPIRFFRNRISFAYVDSMEAYDQVVHLRRNAYVEAGKKASDTPVEAMSTRWDRISRILCIYHEDVLAASATLTFPEADTEPLRSRMAFPGAEYPCPVPPITEFIEVNGLCTHKDYRKGDLLHAVFEQIARAFLFSGRSHILTLTDGDLLPLYRKIGFRELGHKCIYLDREHHLILLDRRAVQSGRGMPILTWLSIYGDLIADLLERGFLKPDWREALIIRAKLRLRPMAQRLLGRKLEKTFHGLLQAQPRAQTSTPTLTLHLPQPQEGPA